MCVWVGVWILKQVGELAAGLGKWGFRPRLGIKGGRGRRRRGWGHERRFRPRMCEKDNA